MDSDTSLASTYTKDAVTLGVWIGVALSITSRGIIQQLADTRPLGIGSIGAGSSGMPGRQPGDPP